MSTKEKISKAPSGRPQRTPVGTRNVLTVKGKDDNFEYRVVNDEGDRIEQFLDAGYEKVLAKDVRIGDKRVNGASPEGSFAQISVGGGKKGILMRIPKEWYAEDQAAKAAALDDTVAATKSKALDDDRYGKLETS